MSRWTHNLCEKCWNERNPGRDASRLVEDVRAEEVCCNCGTPNRDGIYQRADPDTMPRCFGH